MPESALIQNKNNKLIVTGPEGKKRLKVSFHLVFMTPCSRNNTRNLGLIMDMDSIFNTVLKTCFLQDKHGFICSY